MTPATARRRGAISLVALLAIPMLLLLVGLVVYVGLLRETRGEVQGGADGAALAAAQALATDDLIRSGPAHAADRLDRARAAAAAVSAANATDVSESRDDDGVTFGTLDRPFGEFRTAAGERANAVRVVVGRPPVAAPLGGRTPDRPVRSRATALLDRHVTGFSPVDGRTAPVVPLGLSFADPDLPEGEWEPAWRRGADEWRFDPVAGTFEPGADGIPEYEVVVGGRGRHASGAFLRFGGGEPEAILRQLRSGVTAADLAKWGGGLSLAAHNTLTVSSSVECPPPTHPLYDSLAEAVRAGHEPRVWPLIAAADADDEVRIRGWTGARVVSVTSHGSRLKLLLQPAVVCHPSAVAGAPPRPEPAFWAGNRTVWALRLAE